MGGKRRPLPGHPGCLTVELVAMATGTSGRGGQPQPRVLKMSEMLRVAQPINDADERREQRQARAAAGREEAALACPSRQPRWTGIPPSTAAAVRGRRRAHAPLCRVACRELQSTSAGRTAPPAAAARELRGASWGGGGPSYGDLSVRQVLRAGDGPSVVLVSQALALCSPLACLVPHEALRETVRPQQSRPAASSVGTTSVAGG